MTRCRACREEIDFVRLRSGKLMPVESASRETYYVPGAPRGAVSVDGHAIERR